VADVAEFSVRKENQNMMDFFAPFNWGFWILLLALAGLVGLLIVLRNKRDED
jgi:hypothetical protein